MKPFFRNLFLKVETAILFALALAFAIPAAAQVAAPPANFRNLIVCGDFGTCPWQRGATSGTVNTTATYWADNWFGWANNAGSTLVMTKQTVANTTLTNFSAALQAQRTAANANTTQICVGQTVETLNVSAIAGQTVTLSFHAVAGANFSAASSNLQVSIVGGTGTDQGAASLLAGTWTGQSSIVNQTLTPISTTWGRVALTAFVPQTTTELAIEVCYTPVGTAGANDLFQITGVQLEQAPAGTIGGLTGTLALNAATPFEKRAPSVDTFLAQRYLYVMADAAATVRMPCMGQASTTTNVFYVCTLPVPMRTTPTVTVSTATSFNSTVAAGTVSACTTLASVASSGSAKSFALACTTAADKTAGFSSMLWGAATAGIVTVSAEP